MDGNSGSNLEQSQSGHTRRLELEPIQILDLIGVQLDECPVDRIGGCRPPWSDGNLCEWYQFFVRCLSVINSWLIAYNSILTYITLKSIQMSITFINT